MPKRKTNGKANGKVGHSSIYTTKLALKLCERLAVGESLVEICRSDKMPSYGTVTVDSVTGVITYEHTASHLHSDSFAYTVRDYLGIVSAPTEVLVGIDGDGCSLVSDGIVQHLDAARGLDTAPGSDTVTLWRDATSLRNDVVPVGSVTRVPNATLGHPAVALDGGSLLRTGGLHQFPHADDARTLFAVESTACSTTEPRPNLSEPRDYGSGARRELSV